MAGAGPWLLVGNSRWHWAQGPLDRRRYWSESPHATLTEQPVRWAAVGPLAPGLDPATRITLAQIPLAFAPAWLGVDRALAGWQAWQRSTGPVLVADAALTAEALAAQLQIWAEDRDLLTQMGAKARALAQPMAADTVAHHCLDLLHA